MTSRDKTALLVIDMLNDFVSDSGALLVKNAKKIVPNIKREIEQARKSGIPAIYLCDSHDERDSEFQSWPKHAVANTWGSKIIDDLAPTENDYVIPKRRYSGFFATDLDLLLRELKIEKLILTGTVTNICVYFTAVDGCMRGYKLVVPRDCVVALNDTDHKFALRQLRDLCNAQIL